MRIVFNIIALWLLVMSPLSCIDEITLKVDDVEQIVVIEGLIADSLDTYNITVKESKNKGLYPISGAIVQVIDDKGTKYVFSESASKEGNYQRIMKADESRLYFVQVTIGNKIYESIPSGLQKSPAISNTSHVIDTRVYIDEGGKQISEVDVNTKIDVTFDPLKPKPYLRWRTLGEYEFHEERPITSKWCYVKDFNDFNKLVLYNPFLNPSNSLKNQLTNYTELDGRFAILYCFHIYQYTMKKEEYDYWKSLQALIENKGTLYDPPVGNVKGNLFNKNNLEEQVVGYFSVAGVKYTRYFLDGNNLGGHFPGFPCGNFFNRPAVCQDCLIIKNSTINKPSYWP